ncbi:adenylyl-sulfate kinase [bacterium (Candidatus Blackallbacteria) CG17_big_fil_post_rev_8_21_14_2_50_48_46]|uniref:Adenylyl-sulfate kinase n=1 Tax=bacterium (Candidatus Blackallbacteria) CG17_big_fil_post_rev_8_21_14_2_50_48_46 TaxID=2014261 RepID=A0A2M7G9N5_9BACT|nr:MAG: adenylyl-sulfate kinase [bacterium (Candidatus Blackallbacteria) CG18_big_fil_WC_8_21_14_2_50_49_26]PIW18822.1 MAG: adenylyl-sulfate kinase [bacterium (Candidatus Blackallbacteria) CG17_big_fil_post_rev_8_21_14_2_50_48_46]PIW49277.1 MAG: adenylyl-sulfate kinase [bacterium (Candidatus Blackallbacteria) CG13_big_fil_rev_8_21_14_2_50_49_14]
MVAKDRVDFFEKNKVYWLTGLAGSGKSTLGKQLWQTLRSAGQATVYLDGDVLREVFGKTKGYSRAERLELAWRYSHMCHMLSIQGLNVVCATISLFHEVQAWNRKNLPGYIEIFLDTPFEILQERDQKSLYSKALAGEIKEVVGVDIEPEWPQKPDIHLVYQPGLSPEECFIDLQKQIQRLPK